MIAYTEDELVQQTTAKYLEQLGRESFSADNKQEVKI
jgi:hypothetical protein